MKTFTNENSQQMVDMQEKIFGVYFISVEAGLFNSASQCSKDYLGGSWMLVTDDAETTGFMYPTGRETYNVSVDTNGFTDPIMPAVAFGAALTIMVTNHMCWAYHERGQPDAAQRMANVYEKVREFVFNLADDDPDFLDCSAVVGFID